jgi:hypothetical protein
VSTGPYVICRAVEERKKLTLLSLGFYATGLA